MFVYIYRDFLVWDVNVTYVSFATSSFHVVFLWWNIEVNVHFCSFALLLFAFYNVLWKVCTVMSPFYIGWKVILEVNHYD